MFALSENLMAEARVRSYEDAAKKYETTLPWGNEEWGHQRPLRQRKMRQYTIEPASFSGCPVDYILRYHGTELVRYNADGTIRITGWPSRSSMAFINALTPYRMQCELGGYEQLDRYFLTSGASYECVSYPFEDRITVRPTDEGFDVVSGVSPFQINVSDRAAINKVLRADPDYDNFRTWAAAYVALRGLKPVDTHGYWRGPDYAQRTALHDAHETTIYEMLRDRNQWPALVTGFASLSRCLDRVRRVLKDNAGVDPRVKTVSVVRGGWRQIPNIVATDRRNQ